MTVLITIQLKLLMVQLWRPVLPLKNLPIETISIYVYKLVPNHSVPGMAQHSI